MRLGVKEKENFISITVKYTSKSLEDVKHTKRLNIILSTCWGIK